MSSDSRLIFYSTIHLSRREEILIQSIISLYNSKDNFKWIYRELGDNVSTIVVGSEAKSLIRKGEDPFLQVDEKHVVIMLGDLFYPKNARALVRVALPIKALDLVDKLSHVERNIIGKQESTGYIAANIAAAMLNANSGKRDDIDFIVDKTTTSIKSNLKTDQQISDTKPSIHNEINSSVNANQVVDKSKNLSSFNESSIQQNSVNEPSVTAVRPETNKIAFKISPTIEEKKVPKDDDTSLGDFPNVKFIFPFDGVTTDKSNSILTNEEKDLDVKDDFTYVSPEKAIEVGQYPAMSNNSLSVSDSKDAIEYHIPQQVSQAKTNNITSEIKKPLLERGDITVTRTPIAPNVTENSPNRVVHHDNVVPLHNGEVKSTATQVSAEQIPRNEKSIGIMENNQLTEPTKTEVVGQSVDNLYKRIKLIRWPKSEVIQRHPGNAILASMVINVPMSVEDMAKQSDLPIKICQNFVNAVIEGNVAVYVDLPSPGATNQTRVDTATVRQSDLSMQETEKTKHSNIKTEKRKGILYRIRAALGLLRN